MPRGLTPEELAGGFGLPDAAALSGRIEESFRRRLMPLPPATRLLLLVAAAEPVGDQMLVRRAADRLGVEADAAAPAAAAGLVELAGPMRFRHPLVRSAVYRAASPKERRSCARGARGVERSGRGSGSSRVAPRPGGVGARRGGRRRARALGRPGARPGRPGGGGRVPPARRRVDARAGTPRPAGAGRGTERAPGRRAGCGAADAGDGGGRTARRARTCVRGACCARRSHSR